METLTTAGSLWAALLTLGPPLGLPPPPPTSSSHLTAITPPCLAPWFTLVMGRVSRTVSPSGSQLFGDRVCGFTWSQYLAPVLVPQANQE